MDKYKYIDFAQPTSLDASEYGHGKTGCYLVIQVTGDENEPSNFEVLGTFEKLESAKEIFDSLDYPIFPPFSRFCYSNIQTVFSPEKRLPLVNNRFI